jgi:hypothetical protein
MTTYYLQADLTFKCTDPTQDTDDNFDAFTDAVGDELDILVGIDKGLIDPDLTVGIVDRWVSFLIGIKADSHSDAVRLFSANLRTALHAAGCGTQGWPTFKPTTETPDVRKAELAST